MNDDTKMLVSRLAHLSEWEALEQHLNEVRAKKIQDLLGGYSTHDDYLRATGFIAGLDAVLTAPVNPLPRPVRQLSTSRH